MKALGLFSGVGGWEVHDAELGIETWGIENDNAACATAVAAGFQVDRQDVTKVHLLPRHGFQLLKAGPPCQTFSAAGLGAGRKALDVVLAELHHLVSVFRGEMAVNGARTGWKRQTEWIRYAKFSDVRTGLVLEPLRFALVALLLGEPFEGIALEQVPAVLPVWEAYAVVLRELGYSVATGILQAEQFGAPQTRKRAVLIARLHGEAALPTPTHSKYYPHKPDRLDEGVKPWVSMVAVLSVTADSFLRSNYGTGGDPANRGERSAEQPAAEQPAATVTSKIDRNKWQRRNSGPGAARTPRPVEQPSYTIRAQGSGSHPSGVGATSQQTAGQIPRGEDQPAHTITGKGTAAWVLRNGNQAHSAKRDPETPAPTVHFSERSNKVEWMNSEEAANPAASGVRVTVEEAALLQTFPAGYPWQGTKTQQYQQVGNAIPPLLAKAILQQVI